MVPSAAMRVLVTGGAGFIGSNLVDALLRRGHAVRVLDNFSSGHRRNLAHVEGDIELVEGELRELRARHHAVRGCEVVFHQGALPSVPRSVQDPLTTSEINVGGHAERAAQRPRRGRQAASCSRPRHRSTATARGSRAERVQRRCRSHRTRCRSSRRSSTAASSRRVYGLETRFAALLQRLRPAPGPAIRVQRRDPALHHRDAGRAGARRSTATGEQSRDFTHIDNVVAANLLAMDATAASPAASSTSRAGWRTRSTTP